MHEIENFGDSDKEGKCEAAKWEQRRVDSDSETDKWQSVSLFAEFPAFHLYFLFCFEVEQARTRACACGMRLAFADAYVSTWESASRGRA